jgi:hypothetical protein
MKLTIAALFGVIAMAGASNHPPSVADDVAKEFKERHQVKKDVELNTQEILKRLSFYFNDRQISFADEDLDDVNIFTSV